jgi:hypothetical protein
MRRIIAKFFPGSWPTAASIVTNGVQRELLMAMAIRAAGLNRMLKNRA